MRTEGDLDRGQRRRARAHLRGGSAGAGAHGAPRRRAGGAVAQPPGAPAGGGAPRPRAHAGALRRARTPDVAEHGGAAADGRGVGARARRDGALARGTPQAHRGGAGRVSYKLAKETLEEERRLADGAARRDDGDVAQVGGVPDPASEAGRDPAAFAVHFERKSAETRLNGATLRRGDEIPDGAVLEFPAGVHSFYPRNLFPTNRFPKDLVLAGVGMDQTLVRIEEISTDDEIASLTFRDLTLDCDNDYMTDLRSESPATIRLERCRVVGFDMAAGGSVIVRGADRRALCDRLPLRGGLRAQGRYRIGQSVPRERGLLVRMERCLFHGPFRSIFRTGDASTYHFLDCEVRDTKSFLRRSSPTPARVSPSRTSTLTSSPAKRATSPAASPTSTRTGEALAEEGLRQGTREQRACTPLERAAKQSGPDRHKLCPSAQPQRPLREPFQANRPENGITPPATASRRRHRARSRSGTPPCPHPRPSCSPTGGSRPGRARRAARGSFSARR